ncbi:hypothetical protein ABH926_010237 [Catenulispora sp. GP43]|uniref:hypothetical protein n=1 Tax=Catenulispora sp. GP43 TaxID=3156263 RepID=UPI003513293D
MQETDVGRVFAAVAPETVPTVGGLPERARALGRRQRRRRAAMTGGGAGLALAGVVGAVVTLGGFGAGRAESASPGPGWQSNAGPNPGPTHGAPSPPPSAPTSAPTSAPPSTLTPANGLPPGTDQATDDPGADAKVLAAIKAALPAGDRDKPTLYRAASTPKNGYGAEYNWGPRSQETVFDISVGPIAPVLPGETPTMCQADLKHCTIGNATLHGNPVVWQYYYGSLSNPTLNIYDYKAMVGYLLSPTGPNASRLPGLAELKDVGLNEQVASALLAAWKRQ